ncbi:MAG TPA: hypothetical protein VNS58_13925 [Puia sp.]|nr:hypothetical protein [Puia sp.]
MTEQEVIIYLENMVEHDTAITEQQKFVLKEAIAKLKTGFTIEKWMEVILMVSTCYEIARKLSG